jgi:cytoskeletal protein CcmA (bactofilin family)
VKAKNTNLEKDEVTIISTGVKIEGTMTSSGNVRVDGTIEGDVNARGNITIGEHGQIKGQVEADNVLVGGKILGTINAKEKLVLEANSVLEGDIVTKILVIAPGAKFEGSSKMFNNEQGQAAPSGKKTE